jgi:hypothetical protein
VSWSQSQQEKLEQRKAEIQKRLENEKMLLNVKSKEKSECFFDSKQDSSKSLINTTEANEAVG